MYALIKIYLRKKYSQLDKCFYKQATAYIISVNQCYAGVPSFP